MLADEASQHLLYVLDHRVEREHGRLQHLLPAEREQLLREPGRPVGRVLDLLDLRVALVRLPEVQLKKFGIARDHSEKVLQKKQTRQHLH